MTRPLALEMTADGLYLPALDLHLDPRREVRRAFISHAHADHTGGRAASEVLASSETAALVAARADAAVSPATTIAWTGAHEIPIAQTHGGGTARLSIAPAGHVLGAAQLIVDHPGGRFVYTGDYQSGGGLTHGVGAPVECDQLVIESTFALPIFSFPDRARVRAAIVEWALARLAEGKLPVVLAYALGKSQEIVRALLDGGAPVVAHGAIYRVCSLRVGAQGGVLEGAIGRAFGIEVDALRRAAALVTDPGALAVLARDNRLEEARLELGRPVAYMLATPLETIATPLDPATHVIEDKIDGVRAQIHKRDHEIAIFARGLERVTTAFPEVVDALRFVHGNFALDGELVVMGPEGRVRPFQALQARLRRTTPTRERIEAAPVVFIAYDILWDGAHDLLALPWSERRAALVLFHEQRDPAGTAFRVNDVRSASEERDGQAMPFAAVLDRQFEAARARGHEGLVLKRIDAPYDAGRRGQAWIKVKRAFATLDVVITAAEEGHGKRAGQLSDYTFAVWRGEGDDRELVNVGKAYSGLTDVEIAALGRRLVKLTRERFGRVRAVDPAIVLEVAFDGVQRSTRHKSGFALRFPRILRIRDDKEVATADTLATVEALFASQVETGHREEATTTSTATPRKRAKRAASASSNRDQLSLFDGLARTERKE